MANYPPGVSNSDFSRSGPFTCPKCSTELTEENQETVAVEDQAGKTHRIAFCEDHATEDNAERELTNRRSKGGVECAVCHKPLLQSEGDKEQGEWFCPRHDYEAFQTMLEHEEEQRMMELEERGPRIPERE